MEYYDDLDKLNKLLRFNIDEVERLEIEIERLEGNLKAANNTIDKLMGGSDVI